MIAIDTSSLVAYLADDSGASDDVAQVEFALQERCAIFPPVVIAEMLSDHKLSKTIIALIKQLPVLTITNGYWERAGLLRASIIKRGFKARLADTLIAQSCIDAQIALITRDNDYRHFVRIGSLRLYSD